MTRLIALALLVLACAVPTGVNGSENLIPNYSFEVDANGDGMPDGWRFEWKYTHSNDRERGVEKHKPQMSWDDTVVRSGNRSLFVANERPEDDGVWTLADMPVDGSVKYYKLQTWIKTQDMHDTEALVSGVFLGDEGKWLGADYQAIAVNSDRDWTRYTGYLQPPKGTTSIRIRLWLNMRYTGTGAVWYDDVSLVPTDRIVPPMQRYEDDRPMPTMTAGQQAKGYVCYVRDYLRLVFPTSVPAEDEIDASLSCFAAPLEKEPVAFAIRSTRDLKAVRVICTALEGVGDAAIAREHISVRPVRYGKKKGQSRWGMFHADVMVVPQYLASDESVDIGKDTSQQYWITVSVPRDTPPGTYRGTVTVSTANATDTQLPLEVEVLPIQLIEPGNIYFGMYHRPVGDEDFRAAAWRDMREHGMTTVGLCCNLSAPLTLEGDRVEVTFDGSGDLERAVGEYLDAGFSMPIDWLMGSDVLRWCKTQANGQEQRFADYLFTLQQLVKELAAAGDERAERARVLWNEVSGFLSRIDFNGSTGSAAQGDWTGHKELSPEGDKIVSGDHKMANGFSFTEYNFLRRKIADAILELTAPR